MSEKRPVSADRIPYLSFIQVVSAFAVVVLHTNGCFWEYSSESYWFTANIIECLFYFAVPVFFMNTGITLIDYQDRYSTKEYFMKRIRKTFVPFVSWSLIGLCFKAVSGSIDFNTTSFSQIFNSILAGRLINVYWFFPVLFCIYLCIPLFASISKNKRNSVFIYLLCCGFIINNLLPFLINVLRIDIALPLSLQVISGHLIFVIGGVVIHTNDLGRRTQLCIYILGLIGFLLHLIGTYKLSSSAGSIVSTYKGYTNVPSILYSFGIFVFLKQIGTRIMEGRLSRLFCFLKDYTFPVYLMHWFIITALQRVFQFDTISLIYRLGLPVLIFIITICITRLIRMIPFLKRILP